MMVTAAALIFAYATEHQRHVLSSIPPLPEYRLPMTIAGLWDYIKKHGLARPVRNNELAGKDVVVDASIWCVLRDLLRSLILLTGARRICAAIYGQHCPAADDARHQWYARAVLFIRPRADMGRSAGSTTLCSGGFVSSLQLTFAGSQWCSTASRLPKRRRPVRID